MEGAEEMTYCCPYCLRIGPTPQQQMDRVIEGSRRYIADHPDHCMLRELARKAAEAKTSAPPDTDESIRAWAERLAADQVAGVHD